MNNKHKLETLIKSYGYTLGGYDKDIDQLSQYANNKIKKEFCGDSTDIEVSINRKKYILEVWQVDNEIDFILLSKAEYINRYGSSRY